MHFIYNDIGCISELHRPMFNDNRVADWLSMIKEIRNPHCGKAIQDCGAIKTTTKLSLPTYKEVIELWITTKVMTCIDGYHRLTNL